MVGTYRMDDDSVAKLKEKGYIVANVTPSIQLFADGFVAIKDMPDCYTDLFKRGHGKYLQGNGQWEVEDTDFGYGITLTIARSGSMRAGPWDKPRLALPKAGTSTRRRTESARFANTGPRARCPGAWPPQKTTRSRAPSATRPVVASLANALPFL